ncbi:thiopurine S-methyltransferase [Streptococcus mutans]|uniref:thiopurine S-methyltransferase n=1 Tax=Streptococcus mutans TaxID=1309 RepID=UPI0028ECF4A0|nr:thiopurine S-methyltransferase [Streptococcus mutans]MDT9554892.1 thiopurine S-methyltransferase [Streptococcus mutans]MDT9574538.1 thiopurine S-methyltransferase [Streptococcus mutans]MDT9578095.1 thiopurine S-methyltransferase [Streptococcus mutans]
MGLFNRQDGEVIRGGLAQQRQAPKLVQEIEMVLDYFDESQETITITYNLEELQKRVVTSFETGASMNFTTAIPPFSLNPHWIKKVTYRTKEDDSM